MQVQRVKQVLKAKDTVLLSRGQKKRLKKKERFISAKIIEDKGLKLQEELKTKLQAKQVQPP